MGTTKSALFCHKVRGDFEPNSAECVSLEVYLYTILTTCLFYTFGYSFCVWDDYLSYCGCALFSLLLLVGLLPWLLLFVIPLLLSLVLLLLVGLLFLVSSWLLFKTFCYTLLMAQKG